MKKHSYTSNMNNKENFKHDEKSSHQERPHFSQAAIQVAKNNLKEFEYQTDEAFLVRAKINRKLSSL